MDRNSTFSAESITVRVPQAAKMLGVGRTTIYALIKAREIQTVKVGAATLIVVASLRELVAKRQSER